MRLKSALPATILAVAPAAALLLVVLSVLFGAKSISAREIWEAIVRFDENNVDHQIILTSRLPRVLGAMLIGAFLAVSGALMQGMTRNYLASPSIMGVSDGSLLIVTLCMIFLPNVDSIGMIAMSIIGSAIGAGLVFGIAWLLPNGMSPVRLAILGTIVGTFLQGVAQAAATYFQVSQGVSFWFNARLHQMDPEMIKLSLPFAVVGLALAIALSGSVSALSLGDEVAANLGIRVRLIKGLTMLAAVILTGISVALAGKIAFIGLIIPHIARMLARTVDYRWLVPVSGALGALFLAACDLLARFVNYPFETPIGVVTALFGVPFFLYLIQKRGGGQNA